MKTQPAVRFPVNCQRECFPTTMSSAASFVLHLARVGVSDSRFARGHWPPRESALRSAPGARRGNILTVIFRRALPPAAAGPAFGLSSAWAFSIYGVQGLLVTAALVATYAAARRAKKTDPAGNLWAE